MEPERGYSGQIEPAISWSAILAGAAVGLGLAVALTGVAAGFEYRLAFGMASRGALSAFTPTVGAVAVVVQVLSAGLGGYVAGRMRHHWASAHTDEAHFRDTAQGLIVWGVITVASVLLAAPFADQLAAVAASAPLADTPARAAGISAQASLFMGVGMLLSAFTAAVAARVGGMRTEEMHVKGRAVRA